MSQYIVTYSMSGTHDIGLRTEVYHTYINTGAGPVIIFLKNQRIIYYRKIGHFVTCFFPVYW